MTTDNVTMNSDNQTTPRTQTCPVCHQEVVPGVDHYCPPIKPQTKTAHLLCPACGEHLIVTKAGD